MRLPLPHAPVDGSHSMIGWLYPVYGTLLTLAAALGLTTYVFLGRAMMAIFVALGFIVARKVNLILADASTDPLTKVLNRRQFDRYFHLSLPKLCRHGDSLALLLIDLDKLKTINDSGGHLAGDEALRLVGESLRLTVRSSDLVARFGGDEFVIMAPNTDADHAVALANRLRDNLRQIARTHRLAQAPTVSIGVATTTGQAARAIPKEALFEAADQALYSAKNSGRDRTTLGTIAAG